MSQPGVKVSIEALQRTIDAGNHSVEVAIEPMGDTQEVAFYVDDPGMENEPCGVLVLFQAQPPDDSNEE